jgi:cytochrome c2
VAQFGCPACHAIPGFAAGEAQTGPSLAGLSRRDRLAGGVANTPENLIRWIRRPSDVVPGTAMPVLGLSEQDAKDIAAFLYSLP